MRISDWSSDVCSSDLIVAGDALTTGQFAIADSDNTATATAGSTASAGDDTISAGAGNDSISGDALAMGVGGVANATNTRSEEHTSELQSLMRTSYAVFFLKKNTKNNIKCHLHLHNKIAQ